MKMKSKKIISVFASMALTAAFTCGAYSDINFKDKSLSAPFVVCASEAEAENWQADVYYVIVDEIDENDGTHCQWYTTDNVSFRKQGIHVKINGVDVTDTCTFEFAEGKTPAEVYDGINTDYMIPVTVTPDGGTSVTTSVWVKIGQRGDVNLDHAVDVCDSSAIARDVAYFKKNSVSRLDEFGLFLASPDLEMSAYPLDYALASTLAKQFAKNALKRATGEKLERDDVESEYSISISGASNALPGETVALQVVVEADDTFESLDALIEWDDDNFKSAGAVAVNGTFCESYVEDGMLSVIDYSSGTVHDGAIATIEFKVPEDAVPGSNMEIYFSDIETFAVGKGTSTEDVSNVVNVIGTSIKVLKPSGTTAATTTPVTTTTTSVATTASQTTPQQTSATTASATTASATSSSLTSSVISTSQTTAATSVTTSTSATVQTTVTTTVPVTTTTKTSEPLIVIPIPRGDANLDGVLDVRDAALIARRLARGEGTLLPDIADYNLDGKKNVSDAAAIARFLSVVSVL